MTQPRKAIEEEMRRRADAQLSRTRLIVHYYRIRRRMAYPLPVRQLHLPKLPVSGIPDYPWSIWLLWAIEERIGALGWAGEWFGSEVYTRSAAIDLSALAEWPLYRQLPRPDLAMGHSARMLWTALKRWAWLDERLRGQLTAALRRIFEDGYPLLEAAYGSIRSKSDVLAASNVHSLLHNIPLIGTIGVTIAGEAADCPAAQPVNDRVEFLVSALLDRREAGHSEATAYDGYLLDFIALWLETRPNAQRRAILEHPRLNDFLEQSYMLGAPGEMMDLAELGDVEPVEMPFHTSAQARLQSIQPSALRAWYLSECPLPRLRCDALAQLRALPEIESEEPPAGALDAHHAIVLRSGWSADDLAVAVGASNAPMGHIHCDYGSILVGTRGRWLVTDPGYQQYLKKKEREFTLGPAAHNCPVINGQAARFKAGRCLARETAPDGGASLRLELKDCYPPELGLETVQRTVWLLGNSSVVLADCIRGKGATAVGYHWHGAAEAAWWVEDSWALIHLNSTNLWMTSPQCPISEASLDRLPGSRGQLTLSVLASTFTPAVWWIFGRGERSAAPFSSEANGLTLRVGDRVCEMTL